MAFKKNVFTLLFLLGSFMGYSNILYVTNGNDSGPGSLRNEIANMVTNDTLIINYKGVIGIDSTIQVETDTSLTIIAPYPTHNSFSAEGFTDKNIFRVTRSHNITFIGFGFIHFFHPIANLEVRSFLVDSSSVTIIDCLFERNKIDEDGGAIKLVNSSTLNLFNSSFIENESTTGNGGAIHCDHTDNMARIENCTFYQNKAVNRGGAIYIDSINVFDSYNIQNNTFYENSLSASVSSEGQAIDFRIGPTSVPNTYIYFFHNLFYQNGSLGDHPIYYPNYATLSLTDVFAEHNYVLIHSIINANSVIPANFRTIGFDYWDDNPSFLGLRSSLLEDGYGLKYFTITNGASFLIDVPLRTTGLHLKYSAGKWAKDCRRAPRVIATEQDIGASEYTPYLVTSTAAASWETMVISLNTSISTENFLTFDIAGYNALTDHVSVNQTVANILVPVYIDGYGQEGSQIPGPNNTTGINDEYTPASGLVEFKPTSAPLRPIGFQISADNITIAGLGIDEFSQYGIQIDNGIDNTVIFGNSIGFEEVAAGFQTNSTVANDFAGINILGDNTTIGGYFHHERNVITGNGSGSSTGANIIMSNVNSVKVIGNVIGLAPEGKDSLEIAHVNMPDGIRMSGASSIMIGRDYIFGKNIISGNIGSGIYAENSGTSNSINYNHIGVNFLGDTKYENDNGITIKRSGNAFRIGALGQNVISGNINSGVVIDSSKVVYVYGNIIGGSADLTGTVPNNIGVEITGTGTNNIIGGNDIDDVELRNVIVGNNVGVNIDGTNAIENHIRGNLIGVNAVNAAAALPNLVGVKISGGANKNVVGSEDVAGTFKQINIISGNINEGVLIQDTNSIDNIIKSNVIGSTNPAGTPIPMGNDIGVGILNVKNGANFVGNKDDMVRHLLIHDNRIGVKIDSSDNQFIHNSFVGLDTLSNEVPNTVGIYISPNSFQNVIGGSDNEGNIISGNDSAGVFIDSTSFIALIGNEIGTDRDGLTSMDNRIGVFIRHGDNHKIGSSTDRNTVSGNEVGFYLTKDASSVSIFDNYIGVSSDGTTKVNNSNIGVFIEDVDSTNFIGFDQTQANIFENDSIDILIKASSIQSIKGNLFGFNADSSAYIGTPLNGIGIQIDNSQSNTIGGDADEQNVIANKRVGLLLNNSDSNIVQNNYFGTTPAGNAVLSANNQRAGIATRNISTNNIIGPNNVLGGNRIGILLSSQADSNLVFGNYIGIDTALTIPIANDTGMIISGSSHNQIGGLQDSMNVMVNGMYGIILRSSADTNSIWNNFIGINPDGTSGINTSEGIIINNSNGNQIGAADLQKKNHIANNGSSGVEITGASAGNSLLRNNIYGNGGLAIDIGGGSTPTVNNATGIQDNIQIPIIQSGFPCTGAADIQLSVILRDLTPGEQYYLDLYNISTGTYQDPSGYGESGPSSFYFDTITAVNTEDTLIIDLSTYGLNSVVDTMFTAMLTSESNGSSSEFSENRALLSQPQVPAIDNTTEVCKWANNGELLVDNSANSLYSYSILFDGVTQTPTGVDSLLITNLTPASYTIQLNYDNGCSETYNETMVIGPTFTVSTILTEDTCGLGDGTITLTANPDTPAYFLSGYNYSIDNGGSFGALNANVFAGLSEGDVTNSVIQTDVSGTTCYSDTVMDVVGAYTLPIGELNFGYSSFCEDSIGYVTVSPIRNGGLYSLETADGGAVFDTNNGELSNVSDANVYEIFYGYGTCNSDTNTIVVFNVPVDDFTFADFCQNETGLLPVPVTAGGAYSILSQPAGNGNINVASGELFSMALANDLTAGTYQVIYNTSDANCPRQDTVVVEVFGKPVAPNLSSPVTNGDTAFFCPTSIDSVFADTNPLMTIWFLEGQANVGPLGFFDPSTAGILPNTYDTLYSYSTIDYTTPSVKTCLSDTSTIKLHMYDTPIDPIIDYGDTAYCDGEAVHQLETTSGDQVNWYQGVGVNLVSTGASDYTIPLQVYDNSSIPFFAQDSTGIGCLSGFDGVTITFHALPITPNITSSTIINDTSFICPTSSDLLFADTDSIHTFWFIEGSAQIDTTDEYLVTLPDLSDTLLYFYKDTVYATRTCYSAIDSIQVHVYNTPVAPIIEFGDTSYCEGEEIDTLINSALTTAVSWYQDNTITADSINSPNFVINAPVTYANDIVIIYAQDVSGPGCISDFDTVEVHFNAKPIAPILSSPDIIGDTAYFCPTGPNNVTASPSVQTFWFLEGQAASPTGPTNTYTPAIAADSYDTLYAYNTIDYSVPQNKTCQSDLDTIVLHMYRIPVVPIIEFGDTSYCEGELIDTLVNSALTTSVNWFQDNTVTPDSIGASHFVINSPVTYANDIVTIYAQDITGPGCISDFDTVDVYYHASPTPPILSSLDINGDTAYFCPTSPNDVTASNTNQTYWYLEGQAANATGPSATYIPSIASNSYDTLYAYNTIDYTVPQNKTCQSELDTLVLHMYRTPVSPIINFGDVSYCEGDLVDTLVNVGLTHSVNWYQGSTSGFADSIDADNFVINAPANYNGDVIQIFAQDSTGLGCLSDFDTTTVIFNPNPTEPIITGGGLAYCEGDLVDTLKTVPISVNWYVNDTIGGALILSDSVNYLPNYDFNLGDSVITFYAQEVSAEGCKSPFDTSQVTFYQKPDSPVLNGSNALIFCPEDPLDTLVTDIVSHWLLTSNDSDLGTNDSLAIPAITFVAGVTDGISFYHVDINTFCHSDTNLVTIQIFDNPTPPIISTIDTTYCEGDLIYEPLEVNNVSNNTGFWYSNATNFIANNFLFNIPGPLSVGDTMFYFDYLDINNCRSSMDSIQIYMYPTPATPEITTLDSVYCDGDPFVLLESSQIANWYQGPPSQNIILDTDVQSHLPDFLPGTYTVYTQSTVNECLSVADSIEIVIHDLPTTPLIAFTKVKYCDYEDIGELVIPSGVITDWYQDFDFATPIFSGTKLEFALQNIIDSAVFHAQIIDAVTGCASLYDSVTVFVTDTDSLTAGDDQFLCKGYSTQLNASGGTSYSWVNLTVESAKPNPTVSPLEETEYVVTITGVNGCFTVDSVIVFMEMATNCTETVYTAFSPNEDGVNDVWVIEGIEAYESNVLYIYSRWGDLIAKIDNYDNVTNVWDGINQSTGTEVVHGTYYFLLESEGSKVNDGWVQVVK